MRSDDDAFVVVQHQRPFARWPNVSPTPRRPPSINLTPSIAEAMSNPPAAEEPPPPISAHYARDMMVHAQRQRHRAPLRSIMTTLDNVLEKGGIVSDGLYLRLCDDVRDAFAIIEALDAAEPLEEAEEEAAVSELRIHQLEEEVDALRHELQRWRAYAQDLKDARRRLYNRVLSLQESATSTKTSRYLAPHIHHRLTIQDISAHNVPEQFLRLFRRADSTTVGTQIEQHLRI